MSDKLQWFGTDIDDLTQEELIAALKFTVAELLRREETLKKLIEMQRKFTKRSAG